MRARLQGWMVGVLLLGSAVYAIAQENITMTTYYPSPRGVYDQLRARVMQDFDDPANFFLDPNGPSILNILTANTLTVTGATTLNTVAGTTTINGLTTINDNLIVTGDFTLGGVVQGNLNVNGNVDADAFRERTSTGFFLDPGNAGQSLNVNGNVAWGGTLTAGTVPWARLNAFPLDCGTTVVSGVTIQRVTRGVDNLGVAGADCVVPRAVYAP